MGRTPVRAALLSVLRPRRDRLGSTEPDDPLFTDRHGKALTGNAVRKLFERDWPKMTGDERKRMLALIFMEIRADHVEGKRLLVTFKPWPHWEPYVDAVLARKAAKVGGRPCVNI